MFFIEWFFFLARRFDLRPLCTLYEPLETVNACGVTQHQAVNSWINQLSFCTISRRRWKIQFFVKCRVVRDFKLHFLRSVANIGVPGVESTTSQTHCFILLSKTNLLHILISQSNSALPGDKNNAYFNQYYWF